MTWWRREVIYQIYPWSFQDSNGDGIGDLAGITARLDHLRALGIGGIWLSPIYPSPMHDFGYDVSEHCAIDPRFGTLEDFDRLLQESHRRGIRVLMDLVLNHTSDQHPWFLEARVSRDSAKRDWYYWADPVGRGWRRRPPNNWQAVFGGSAWAWDAATEQYYLHSFLKEQPDLNWRNPEVQSAMEQVARFWLDREVDGFRLDAINWIGKDVQWPSNPSAAGRDRFRMRSYLRQLHQHDRDQPETHEALRALRKIIDQYPETVLVGEASADTPGGPAAFYGDGTDELHLVFNFRLLKARWGAESFRQVIDEWERAVPSPGWPTQVLSNHDQSRHATRHSRGVSERQRDRRARMAALLLLTLRGTPFLYYGEEIGMCDGRLRYRDLRDPYTKRYWPFSPGRDPARTPMQWDATPQAGFTTGRPWLPVSADPDRINVAAQCDDPDSLLTLYRRLIHLRRTSPALLDGEYEDLLPEHPTCLVYRRALPAAVPVDAWIIAANLSPRPQFVELKLITPTCRVHVSTDPLAPLDRPHDGAVLLQPEEALLFRVPPE
ncbi:MAG TPA: alpha-glucosidase [Nitrospirales bacterium]|nr:alpha-glucosidase [Nitrospirales bacterium]